MAGGQRVSIDFDRHRHNWDRWIGPGLRHLAEERSNSDETMHDLLARLESGRTTTEWTVPPERFVLTLSRIVAEAIYGPRDAASWADIGYAVGPKRDALGPVEHRRVPTASLADVDDNYDVVVVGAGAGGGVAAMVLAEAGLRVLAVEKGPFLTYEEVGRDHVANHRLPIHGLNTPPDAELGGPRVVGDRVLDRPWRPGYGTNPQVVGGGTRVYQGMAWRLLPRDFELASTYGVPDGSSLADWPITYDDLEPYYTRAEHELGVAGDGGAHRNQGRRSLPYPMPAPPWNPESDVLQAGADRLGLATGPVPLLINTEPRDGRARCVQCGECVGFACPTDAKNGTHNTVLPRAVATGRCTLATWTRATQITTGADGEVSGVELVDERTGARRSVRAGHVVAAAGAVETARLLLVSRSDAHPAGLGNSSDQVGRHLQDHLYVGAFGRFADPVIDSAGPGVRIATCDHIHGLGDVFGGGVLANEVTKLPILHWYWALPPAARRWGVEGAEAMRDLYTRTSHVQGPIQEIPNPDARVTLADDVADRWGVPAARFRGRLHPENLPQAKAMQARAVEWLYAAEALEVWTTGFSDTLTVGQHQAGTARMGDDPATSVTDRWGRVHGHDNLWVMDASVHVNNGGCNPVLTIFALAFRSAERLAAS